MWVLLHTDTQTWCSWCSLYQSDYQRHLESNLALSGKLQIKYIFDLRMKYLISLHVGRNYLILSFCPPIYCVDFCMCPSLYSINDINMTQNHHSLLDISISQTLQPQQSISQRTERPFSSLKHTNTHSCKNICSGCGAIM